MAKIRMPRQEAENPVGSGDTPFPEGTYRGRIEEVRVQDVIRGADGPQFLFNDSHMEGPGSEVDVASIQIGSITDELTGDESVGGRKFFDELLILRVDDYHWDDPREDEPSWHLDQTRRRLTNLALALGAVDEDDDGVGPVEDFDSILRNGELQGMEVVFEVAHRKSGKGKEQRRFPFIKTYMQAI